MTLQFYNLKSKNKSQIGSISFFDLVIDNNNIKPSNLKLLDETFKNKFFKRCSQKIVFDTDEETVKNKLRNILQKKIYAGFQRINNSNKDNIKVEKFFITLEDYKKFSNTNFDYIILDKFRHDEDFIEKYTLYYFKDNPELCENIYNEIFNKF